MRISRRGKERNRDRNRSLGMQGKLKKIMITRMDSALEWGKGRDTERQGKQGSKEGSKGLGM